MASIQQFFNMEELALLVSENLGQSDNNRSLISFILVKQTTFRAATATLWRTLPSPAPLLSIFNAFELAGERWHLGSELQVHELNRFRMYSARVRKMLMLNIHHRDNRLIDEESFSQLFHSLSKSTIFPALQGIGIFTPTTFPILITAHHVLPSSQITSLDLMVDEENLGTMPAILHIIAPSLVNLSLAGSRCLDHSIVEAVSSMEALKKFVIDLMFLTEGPADIPTMWKAMCEALPSVIDTMFMLHPPTDFAITQALSGRSFRHMVIMGYLDVIALNCPGIWDGISNTEVMFFILDNGLHLEEGLIEEALGIKDATPGTRTAHIYNHFPFAIIHTSGKKIGPMAREIFLGIGRHADFHVKVVELVDEHPSTVHVD